MYTDYPLVARSGVERFDCFSGLVDRMFCPMELDSPRLERERFLARMDCVELSSVKLVRVASGPVSVRRREQDIARLASHHYLVKFQLKGESIWSQRGREVHARPGDFVIGSTAEPYSLHFLGQHEMPVLIVPDSIMRRLTRNPDQFLGLRMSGDDADCGLLSSFVAQVTARMNKLPVPMVQRVEATVLDLLGAVLTARTERSDLTRAQLLAQVKLHIQDHLHDRHLGAASLADAFGVSLRLIHALFEDEPTSVGKYIRNLRAKRCREALENDASASPSLTDLALEWGFYDLSHMSRTFREIYGEPPSSFLAHQRRK